MSHFDAALCAKIGRDYRFRTAAVFFEDEAMRCARCGFRSTLVGTPIFAWVCWQPETELPHVAACEICHAAVQPIGLLSPLNGA